MWKTNGDELIYVKEIEKAHQAYACVVCWLKSLLSYRRQLRASGSELDLKATAWVAGFPIANHEVIFRSDLGGQSASLDLGRSSIFSHFYYLDKWYDENSDKQQFVVDFIGPSVDTGFRITNFATPRKFPISIELALILSSVTEPDDFRDVISLRFEGKKALKGVLGGKPYPIFWIDAGGSDDLTTAEDQILDPPKTQDMRDVRKYCDLFIKEYEAFIFRPFIWQGDEPAFSTRPENYDAKLLKLKQTWIDEKEKFEIENDSIEGNDPPEDIADSEKPSLDEISRFTNDISQLYQHFQKFTGK